MAIEKKHYVITGAPSTGKSSVINELKKMNFVCHEEIAREIIKENKETNRNVFPWVNMREFSDMVYDRMKSRGKHQSDDLCFLDRSVVDLIGYMEFANEKAPSNYSEFAKSSRYAKKVFIMPIWTSIYTNDQERKESIEEAKTIDHNLRKSYKKLGFKLIDVPMLSVKERAKFILTEIGLQIEA